MRGKWGRKERGREGEREGERDQWIKGGRERGGDGRKEKKWMCFGFAIHHCDQVYEVYEAAGHLCQQAKREIIGCYSSALAHSVHYI